MTRRLRRHIRMAGGLSGRRRPRKTGLRHADAVGSSRFDLEMAMAGTMPYRWIDAYGARVGVMPRGGSSAEVRWLGIAPLRLSPLECLRGRARRRRLRRRTVELWRNGFSGLPGTLHRWRIDLAAGWAHEEPLDDRAIEFPRFDERRRRTSLWIRSLY